MKRRMIFEQSDDDCSNEEYVPERGEAFYQGFSSSLVEAGKVVIVLTILIILYLLFAFWCLKYKTNIFLK